MPTRLTGFPSLASLGVEAPQPPNLVAINRAPTVNDFATFNTGDLWINTASLLGANPTAPKAEDVWMLVSKNKRIANATWINFSGGNALLTLTGNVGGAVPGDVNQNINTIGDNIGITVVGNPGTNTLTWSLVGGGGGVATQSFHTDDNNVEVPIGTVVIPPVGSVGQINVFGGNTAPNVYTNINTRQGADIHTVDVDLNNSIGQPSTNTAATQGMYALGGSNNFVTDRFMYNYGTRNTFLGNLSGNLAFNVANATDNTCIGFGTGFLMTGAAATNSVLNTFVGSGAGGSTTIASGCTYIGAVSGALSTTSLRNSSVGTASLGNILTGSNNSVMGFNGGLNYVAAESGNVVIGMGNQGIVGENNTIRIGANGGAVATTDNIFIGRDSATAAYNVAVATNNVFIGANNATALTTGSANVALSGGALAGITSGTRNVAISAGSGNTLLTGSYNVMAGYISGSTFTGAESSNICINSPGVIADSNTLRIGTSSGAGNQQLNRAFIHGIYGVNPPGGGVQTVVQDMNGQLGTMAGGPPLFNTTAFYATTTGAIAPFTLGLALVIPLDTIVFDLGGNFNTGTFLYTAPNTGYYWFNVMITLGVIPSTITECTLEIVPSISTGVFGPMSFNPFTYQATTVATGLAASGSWMQLLTAGETVAFEVLLGGGAGNADITGGAGRTFFQGYQIA